MTVVDSKNTLLEQVGGVGAAGGIRLMIILRILALLMTLPLITILRMMAELMTLPLMTILMLVIMTPLLITMTILSRAPERWERWECVPSQFEILAATFG